jgi:guanylate kinase
MDERISGGRQVTVVGPSGSGKTGLIRAMEKIANGRFFPVSMYTTRPVQPLHEGEEPDSYRIHLSREQFEQMRQQRAFLECAEVYGNWYGTPLSVFFTKEAHRQVFILEVDIKSGLRTLMRIFRDPYVIAVVPSRFKDLSIRLARRGRETNPESIRRRLQCARDEIVAIRGLQYAGFIHQVVRTKEGDFAQYARIAEEVLRGIGKHAGVDLLK